MNLRKDIASIPGTILVTGIVVGYIAWLEARNIARSILCRARKAFRP